MNAQTTTKDRNAMILARLRDEATELYDSELHDQYDDSLDSCCDEVVIGHLRYSPSQVLKAVDPVAYRCGFVDWLDAESERIVDIDGNHWDRESVEKCLDGWEGEILGEVEEAEIEGDKDEEADAMLSAIAAFRKTHLG